MYFPAVGPPKKRFSCKNLPCAHRGRRRPSPSCCTSIQRDITGFISCGHGLVQIGCAKTSFIQIPVGQGIPPLDHPKRGIPVLLLSWHLQQLVLRPSPRSPGGPVPTPASLGGREWGSQKSLLPNTPCPHPGWRLPPFYRSKPLEADRPCCYLSTSKLLYPLLKGTLQVRVPCPPCSPAVLYSLPAWGTISSSQPLTSLQLQEGHQENLAHGVVSRGTRAWSHHIPRLLGQSCFGGPPIWFGMLKHLTAPPALLLPPTTAKPFAQYGVEGGTKAPKSSPDNGAPSCTSVPLHKDSSSASLHPRVLSCPRPRQAPLQRMVLVC